MTDSQQLLAEFIQSGSEEAFGELVTRYLDLVHSAALRIVGGDTHLAEDVSQTVFVALARRARALPREVMLGGWLHRNTCFVAAKTMRGERRRQYRERQAVEMKELEDSSAATLAQLAPILDDAINELAEQDRTALLLRFFEQQEFRTIGARMGSSEDAARMKVNRALEKLERLLKHRGITSTASALSLVLSANVVQAAPVGLAASISTAVLAADALSTSIAIAVTKAVTMTTLQKSLIAATLAAAIGTGVYQAHQAATLRHQVQTLQGEHAQVAQRLAALSAKTSLRLPAPPMPAAPQPTALPAEPLPAANLGPRLEAWFKDKPPRLSAGQVEAYLNGNRRNASSLLVAYYTTGEPALLKEAMQNYPTDPQVALGAALDKGTSPEERRQWLDAFKKSAPENALPGYLLALDYFKAGQTDQALQEVLAAFSKPHCQDYYPDWVQDNAEAYLSAGYSVAEAKALAAYQAPQLPPPTDLRLLGQDLVAVATSYRQAGDETSAQAALQIAANLGQRYGNGAPGETLVNQILGLNIERFALGQMDPNSAYGSPGQTVQDRLTQLGQQVAAIKDRAHQVDPLLDTMSDQDWINYTDRWQSSGQEAAHRWVLGKYGQK